jgi:hypothetical protein
MANVDEVLACQMTSMICSLCTLGTFVMRFKNCYAYSLWCGLNKKLNHI